MITAADEFLEGAEVSIGETLCPGTISDSPTEAGKNYVMMCDAAGGSIVINKKKDAPAFAIQMV